jgi:hypothetical protein
MAARCKQVLSSAADYSMQALLGGGRLLCMKSMVRVDDKLAARLATAFQDMRPDRLCILCKPKRVCLPTRGIKAPILQAQHELGLAAHQVENNIARG